MALSTWNIDPAHSGVHFAVRHMVFAKVRGQFRTFSGAIHADESDLAQASVEVEIDAASIDTGVADRDNHLRSPDFLDAARFGKLVFKSTRVEKAADKRYRIHASLTIRDVAREVVLDTEYNGRAKDPWGNARIAFTASTSLDRGDFGLKWNQVLEAGGVLVGERIDIDIEIQAILAAPLEAA